MRSWLIGEGFSCQMDLDQAAINNIILKFPSYTFQAVGIKIHRSGKSVI